MFNIHCYDWNASNYVAKHAIPYCSLDYCQSTWPITTTTNITDHHTMRL